MAIKAVIWDLDGTLIHFNIDFRRARKSAINVLITHGMPKKMLSVRNSILDTVKDGREYFENLGFEAEKIKKIIKQVDREVIKIEYEAAIKASIINGIDRVLEFIKGKNLKQAIFTFNTNENAKISLETVNLINYFEFIAGRDDVEKPKPHPDHLLHICEKLEVVPSEIIVIGDTYRDIDGAIAVGAPSIALHTKMSDINKLQNANFIIEENEIPTKLIETIKALL